MKGKPDFPTKGAGKPSTQGALCSRWATLLRTQNDTERCWMGSSVRRETARNSICRCGQTPLSERGRPCEEATALTCTHTCTHVGKGPQTRRQKWTSLSVGDGLISDFHFLLETFLHFPNILQRLGMNAIRKKNPQMFLFKQTAPLPPVAVTRAWLPMLVGSQGHVATRKGCRRGGGPWPPPRDCVSPLWPSGPS